MHWTFNLKVRTGSRGIYGFTDIDSGETKAEEPGAAKQDEGTHCGDKQTHAVRPPVARVAPLHRWHTSGSLINTVTFTDPSSHLELYYTQSARNYYPSPVGRSLPGCQCLLSAYVTPSRPGRRSSATWRSCGGEEAVERTRTAPTISATR